MNQPALDFLDQAFLQLRDAKGGVAQKVGLNPIALDAFREVIDLAGGDWVFPGRSGEKPIEGTSLTKRLQRACKRAGLEGDVCWQTARHTFVSRLAMMGVPIITVQSLARHASIQMTLRYAHLMPNVEKATFEQLAHNFPGDGRKGDRPFLAVLPGAKEAEPGEASSEARIQSV